MNKNNSKLKKDKNGFSMIELLVVTTIIIILTTIGLVSYTAANKNARNGKRKADMEMVRQALVLYRTDNGSYPSTSVFDTMMTTIGDYTSATTVTDPKNEDVYVYTYTSDGINFTLTALLEPDATAYALTNP
ncbi:MAG: type II secretion system protein GspG [Candidatus Pacebacteria bacterium]|nr:type II secretion system protein GspG [Candidatus Paceibacterota bacterium]